MTVRADLVSGILPVREDGRMLVLQRPTGTWDGEAPSGNLLAAVTYIGRTHEREISLSHEHLGYRWVTLEEWLALPSWWCRENVRRVAGPLGLLPEEPLPEPPPPKLHAGNSVVHANL